MLAVLLCACGSGGGGDGPGAVACEPIEGGAPCCDTSFDVTADDCPEGTEYQVECWTDSEGGGLEHGEDCVDKPGNVLATKACRTPDGARYTRIVSYRPDGSLGAYGDTETFHAACHPNGLVKHRLRLGPGEDIFAGGGCYEGCYAEDGTRETPCLRATAETPECG